MNYARTQVQQQINHDVVASKSPRFGKLSCTPTESGLTQTQKQMICALEAVNNTAFTNAANWIQNPSNANGAVLQNLAHLFEDLGGTAGGTQTVDTLFGTLWGLFGTYQNPNAATPSANEIQAIVKQMYNNKNIDSKAYTKFNKMDTTWQSYVYKQWWTVYQLSPKRLQWLIMNTSALTPVSYVYTATCPYYDPVNNTWSTANCTSGGGHHGHKHSHHKHHHGIYLLA